MQLGRFVLAILLLVSIGLALQGGFQRTQGYGRRQQYYESGPNVPSEFYWSRLRYNSVYQESSMYGYRRWGGGWSQDYPKADNDCLIALRRLTHIDSPSPLNVVDLDSDHIFDYPWIYAVNVHTWTFTDEEARRLHDYLLKGGFSYEKDGFVPKWRAIRNEHGRIMVAICANMHLGDAWEWADSPEYPEKFSGLAFRIVLNYIMYAMTH